MTENSIFAFTSIFLVMAGVGYLVNSVLMGQFFTKLGEPAWKAWVPVYGWWTFLPYGGVHGAWSLLLLAAWVPLLGIVAAIAVSALMAVAAFRVAAAFGKDPVAWTALFVVLPVAWFGVLGFGRASYDAGTLGMMHALTKFDPERGYRFSTYAARWIYQYMSPWAPRTPSESPNTNKSPSATSTPPPVSSPLNSAGNPPPLSLQ